MKRTFLVIGLSFLPLGSIGAQVVSGVLSVSNSHMN